MNVWLKRGLLAAAAWKLFGPETLPDMGDHRVPLDWPGRTVTVDGMELFVREAGDTAKSPLVLVHGWGDDSLMVFHRIVRLLGDDFRIIAVDNRNNGKSDHLRGGYSIADIAGELNGVLAALEVTDATVFGFSMGGLIAQQLTHDHPDRVARLVLSGTAAAVPPLATLPHLLTTPAVALMRGLDRISRTEFSWIRTRYLVSVGAVDQAHAGWAYDRFQSRDPDLYWASAHAIANFDSRPWIGDVAVPTMVLITTRDQLMAPGAQRSLADLMPDPVVHELPGRHEAPLTHADDYARHLRAFVATT